eukprot:UN15076
MNLPIVSATQSPIVSFIPGIPGFPFYQRKLNGQGKFRCPIRKQKNVYKS